MKIVTLSELNAIDFIVKDVSVIFQAPLWTSLGGLGNTCSPRKLNGFLLIKNGSCHYSWKDGNAELNAADLIYLPSGAKRQVTVTGDTPLSFYRICFRLFDAADGEEILFSEVPYVISGVRQRLFDLCEKMKVSSISNYNRLETISSLFEFFSALEKETDKKYNSKITRAIDYIEKHFHENFDMELLAELCYMSQPHLFRLFKSETGKTPLEYKTELRIECAKTLLADGECQVGEIAVMLGFESIYYFSRVFKKSVGISPTEYKNKHLVTP